MREQVERFSGESSARAEADKLWSCWVLYREGAGSWTKPPLAASPHPMPPPTSVAPFPPQFFLALLSAHGQTLLCSGSTAYVEVSRGGFGAAHGKITQYVDAKLQAVKRVALKKEAMEMVAENGFTPDLKEAQTHR